MLLSLCVPGGARLQRESVRRGEGQCFGAEAEPPGPGHPEGSHAVGAPDPGHAAGILEEAYQAFEGVAAIKRGGEPPVAVAGPAQGRPPREQLPPPPRPGPTPAARPPATGF